MSLGQDRGGTLAKSDLQLRMTVVCSHQVPTDNTLNKYIESVTSAYP